jgi:hypothetical protein
VAAWIARPYQTLLRRIQGEYLEMPGLRLTLAQAQRLFGVERALCKVVLEALVDTKFLSVKDDGTYARLTDGDLPRPCPDKEISATATRVVSAP